MQSRAAQVPDDPSGYTAKLEDVTALLPPDLKLPDGFALEADDSPTMMAGKKLAHELGLPPGEFPKMVAFEVQRQVAEYNALEAAKAEQRALLGEKGPARIEAVQNHLVGKIGQEHASALFPMLFTAKQIQAFEAYIAATGPGRAPPANAREPAATKPDFSQLKGAERIHAVRMHAQGRRG